MSVSGRRKGREYEASAHRLLLEHGLRHNRQHIGTTGTDFALVDVDIDIEVKNCAALDLAGWVDQARRQAGDGRLGVVLHHRRGKADPADDYVTMRAGDFVSIVAELVAYRAEVRKRSGLSQTELAALIGRGHEPVAARPL